MENINRKLNDKTQICVIGDIKSPYRCKTCGYFFTRYSISIKKKPKKCPRCKVENPLKTME